MKKQNITSLIAIAVVGLFVGCTSSVDWQLQPSKSDLTYNALANSWDEGIPLGNATVGSLLWQKDSALRMSLDRVDLWDLRPTDSLAGDNFKFAWVTSHVESGDYLPVQKKLDWPYDDEAAPSKIPGAALEFASFGEVENVRLFINNALGYVKWKNGVELHTFVQANKPVGWFVFDNLEQPLTPVLVPPVYEKDSTSVENSLVGQDLARLGYKQGQVEQREGMAVYHQQGWGDFYYDVVVKWENQGNRCVGVWSVTSSLVDDDALKEVEAAMKRGVSADYRDHMGFWKDYWGQSQVVLPDSVLQRQYDNEMYKFGSAARENSYPISLQAVWTADNGKLPPWKGDYHHDLNTQLSYWPAYAGNHLKEESGYLNTLFAQRDVYRAWTKQYFEKEGLAIPGVCTLTGEPMGGWIQYSLSQTTSAWLAQHFYLHWKYSADDDFLKEKGYPFVKEVAEFLEAQTEINAEGKRVLAYTSSPEIFNNSIEAWFKTMTNYDLALTTFLFKAAAEMSAALQLTDESKHWEQLRSQLPDFDVDENGALTFAKGTPYTMSHRHFSHAMAFHPLGLINWEDGEKSQKIIKATLDALEKYGPDAWTGYSYSWLANMKARAFDGEGAREALRTFAECFCLPNTFHANGDQSGTGKSGFTYRPFTLEGNFAFASGVQEMLIQSHTDTLRIFPAIPAEWKDVEFHKLRAQGAFLVDAVRKDGKTVSVEIVSEKGKDLVMISPFDGAVIRRKTTKGERITFTE